MKKATRRIIEKFPKFEARLNNHENISLDESVLKELDQVQGTFLKLAWFFEAPKKESFDLGSLYRHLDNDWLEFALELITEYFREDTYLIQKPSYSLIKDGSDYLSLSQFAEELRKRGLRYDRQKLNLYFERGKVPQPELVIGGVKYWSKKTVQLYGEQEERRIKSV
jgi:protein involved in sex pheromone biosynthesis